MEYTRSDVMEGIFKGFDASNKMCEATDNNAAFKIIWNFVCFWEYGDIVRVNKGKYHMNMSEKISDEIIAKVGYHLKKFIRLL